MKRFWKDVAVIREGDGYGIALDGKPVRTPGRVPLTVPTVALAEGIADEWRAVGDTLDPRAMPLTGLANAAIDRIAPDRAAFAAMLAAYGESDLLCYRAETPEPLVERQRAAWDPLLDWARGRYDVHFETVAGIVHREQPAITLARLREATATLSPWQLAGLSPIVTITGSLIAALALNEGHDAEAIWSAARVDEAWQEELWGSDTLAVQATAVRRADFDAGVRFLKLVGMQEG